MLRCCTFQTAGTPLGSASNLSDEALPRNLQQPNTCLVHVDVDHPPGRLGEARQEVRPLPHGGRLRGVGQSILKNRGTSGEPYFGGALLFTTLTVPFSGPSDGP